MSHTMRYTSHIIEKTHRGGTKLVPPFSISLKLRREIKKPIA